MGCGARELFRARPVALIAAVMLLAQSPVGAQSLLVLRPPDQPEPFVREALATPYGKALVAELGKALRADADASCLQSTGLAADQSGERAGALMLVWGTRVVEQLGTMFDEKLHDRKFAEAAGKGAAAEFAKLRENAAVKRYLALERTWRLFRVADFLFEQFDRYGMLARLKLSKVSPLSTGNDELFKISPEDSLEDQFRELRRQAKSRQLERFIELRELSSQAREASLKAEWDINPATLFRGVEDDLAGLCIGKR